MSRKITASEVQEWADDVSAYLFMLAFGERPLDERPMPPVLGDSTVLDNVKHNGPYCRCPRCRPYSDRPSTNR